ncbi:MAG: lamin tail domain-containing protein [Comamonadaceae bacterium]|nr:lamin tail domain-containing protein [Comamonadaceae bacterium]
MTAARSCPRRPTHGPRSRWRSTARRHRAFTPGAYRAPRSKHREEEMHKQAPAIVAAAAMALLAAAPAGAGVVISQIYGGNGNAFASDYVQLFNNGSAAVDLGGWSLQYASATGTGLFSGNGVTVLGGVLQPGPHAHPGAAANHLRPGAANAGPVRQPRPVRQQRQGRAGQHEQRPGLQRRLERVQRGAAGADRRPGRLRQRELLRRQRRRPAGRQRQRATAQGRRLRRQRRQPRRLRHRHAEPAQRAGCGAPVLGHRRRRRRRRRRAAPHPRDPGTRRAQPAGRPDGDDLGRRHEADEQRLLPAGPRAATATPHTSDGIFVFTGSAAAGVAVGQLVQLTATVAEFAAGSGSVTQLTNPAARQRDRVAATPSRPRPLRCRCAGGLERFEGMLVSARRSADRRPELLPGALRPAHAVGRRPAGDADEPPAPGAQAQALAGGERGAPHRARRRQFVAEPEPDAVHRAQRRAARRRPHRHDHRRHRLRPVHRHGRRRRAERLPHPAAGQRRARLHQRPPATGPAAGRRRQREGGQLQRAELLHHLHQRRHRGRPQWPGLQRRRHGVRRPTAAAPTAWRSSSASARRSSRRWPRSTPMSWGWSRSRTTARRRCRTWSRR